MMAALIKKRFARLALPGLLVSIGMGACTKPGELTPVQPVAPAQYELTDVRYFLGEGDRIDTVTVTLKGYNVQNTKTTLDSQQVENSFDELVKTSQFAVLRPATLPKEVDLSRVAAKVPEYWNGGDSFFFFKETFPLAPTQQQKPYGGFTSKPMPLQIPPRSTIAIRRQVDAYKLSCSFEAVLENKTSGQRYPLTGKWTGILRYNNVSVTLTQHPLP